jgi:hypothetical protein
MEYVPAGVTVNAGQPLVVLGRAAYDEERVPTGQSPSTTVAIAVVGAPASE